MIKVQTLRLCSLASSLLAFAACSGTTNNQTPDQDHGTSPTSTAEAASGREDSRTSQDPQGRGQDPQGQGRQGNQALIEQALRNARASMSARLFEDARNEAAFVLELDNDNAEAREILLRVNEILGDRDPGVGGRFDNLVLEQRIAAERERLLVRRELQQGDAHAEMRAFGRAIESYERALTVLRYSQFFQPNDPLVREAEKKLEAASTAKIEADKQELDRARAATGAELERMSRERVIARELKVERLLEDANRKFQEGAFASAIESIDQALLLDPTNPTAIALRDLADRARHNATMELNRERWRQEWNATISELQHSNVPQTQTVVFDPSRWAEVAQRRPASYTQPQELESPENRAIQRQLEETVLEHSFASATVQDWASYYGTLTGVTFVISPDVAAMDAETTTLNEFALSRRSVADALRVIQTQTGVAYRIRDGLVHLVSPENAIGVLYYERYNISELVQGIQGKPGPDLKLRTPEDDAPLFPEVDEDPLPSVVADDRLQDMLKQAVATDKWDGSPFTMNVQNGMLLVRADRDTHQAIERMLNDLRQHVGIQIDVESRFLRVDDSFLEDVGVDLRGLGNQAAQGLPGRGLENRPNVGFNDFGPSQQQNAATPGIIGTGTEPGVFFNDGGDGDLMGRVENLYDRTLGGRNGGLTNAGGLSLQYAYLDDVEVEVILRAVSKQERSEEIQAPRLLIYNNTRASMHFMRNISYIRDFEVEIAQAAAVANPVIGTVHDGIALDVRPVVDSDLKFITMELRPTVMQLSLPIPTFTTTLGIGQPISIQLPQVTLQRVRTTVTIPDGGTMMLGGMRLVERQNLSSGVPILGDLPGLSFFFSRKGTSLQNRKILILIRAKIVLMEEHEPEAIALPDGTILTSSR